MIGMLELEELHRKAMAFDRIDKKASSAHVVWAGDVETQTDLICKALEELVDRRQLAAYMFQYWPKVDQNLSMIEDIFNKGSIRKVPIRYGRKVREPNAEKEPEKSEVTEEESNGKVTRGKVVTVGGRAVGISARPRS